MLTPFAMQNFIDEMQPSDDFWLNGLLHSQFQDKIEFCRSNKRIRKDSDKIYWLHDEACVDDTDSHYFDKFKKNTFVTANPNRFKDFLQKNIKSVFWPWQHWLYHILPVRKMHILPNASDHAKTKTFSFLNRRWQPGRYYLIEHIFKNHIELFKTGYVTANTFPYYMDHPLLYKDQKFIDLYVAGSKSYESNNTILFDTQVSVNLKNIFYIAEHVPGQIYIQVESGPIDPNHYSIWLTEKSMTPFFCHRLPIIVNARHNYIDFLRNEGFDVFDDIICHDYDHCDDYYQRLEMAISLNYDILAGKTRLPDLRARLQRNQHYLVYEWADNKLAELFIKINCLLK